MIFNRDDIPSSVSEIQYLEVSDTWNTQTLDINSDERLLRGEFKLRYGSSEITSCISHNVSSYELELHLKKLLSITDVSIESIVEVYRKSHTIKFSTPNVDVRELKATAIGSSGCEAFICENGPCMKHSITMNANNGLGEL